MEIENDGDGAALRSLVDALNARAGGVAWAPVETPPGAGGGDAIRVAMIYRPARVAPVGPPRVDLDPLHNRPPLAQAFATPDGAGRFTVVASHFKSRRCDGASGLDLDRGDAAGLLEPSPRGCRPARWRVSRARSRARAASPTPCWWATSTLTRAKTRPRRWWRPASPTSPRASNRAAGRTCSTARRAASTACSPAPRWRSA